MSTNNYVPKEDELVMSIDQLGLDLRRMLTVQFREFVNHIEDHEAEATVESSPRVVNFLERCLRRRAA